MTQEEIIEMAKQAGFEEHQAKFDTRFEPFARLVAEKERERMTVVATDAAGKAIDVALKLEREACAEICDGFYLSWIDIQGRYEFMGEGASECAGAIRARGQA
jgi:hypothetical protein